MTKTTLTQSRNPPITQSRNKREGKYQRSNRWYPPEGFVNRKQAKLYAIYIGFIVGYKVRQMSRKERAINHVQA